MIYRRLKRLEKQVEELSITALKQRILLNNLNWLGNINVKFENTSPNPDPKYEKDGDSGFDLRVWLKEDENNVKVDENGVLYIQLNPHERRLIHTGIKLELPKHTEAQVRPRSGCALKIGLSLANSIGTIDVGYRGEVGIIALNTSNDAIIIKNGERIAQCVICPVFGSYNVSLNKCESINKDSERGEGGFGHTGTN